MSNNIRVDEHTGNECMQSAQEQALLYNFPSIAKNGSVNSLIAEVNQEHLQSKSIVIKKFLSGFKRFQQTYFNQGGLFENLKKGQSPKTLIVGCCDSRADPAM